MKGFREGWIKKSFQGWEEKSAVVWTQLLQPICFLGLSLIIFLMEVDQNKCSPLMSECNSPHHMIAATLTHVWFTYLLKHMFAHVYLCIFVLVYLHFCTCANIIYKGCRVVERWGDVARHIWATLLTWLDTKWCEEEPSEGKGQFRAWSQNKDLPWHILGLFPKITFWNIAHLSWHQISESESFPIYPSLWRESSIWPLSL